MDPVVHYRVKPPVQAHAGRPHETELRVPNGEDRPGALAQNGTVGYVLCVTTPEVKGPDWDRLFETAAGQSGYVTTRQAAEAGVTHPPAPQAHPRAACGLSGDLPDFPVGGARRAGHRLALVRAGGRDPHTRLALSLHGLSDVLPAQIHLTLP